MANLAFLELKKGQEVEMKVEHRSDQDYQPPKPKLKAYSGAGELRHLCATGNRLGSPTTPSAATNMPGSFPSSSSSSAIGGLAAPVRAPPSYQVDASQPTTSIQIRLADGSRQVAKFNHSHTVGDLRQFVSMTRPGESARTYGLL